MGEVWRASHQMLARPAAIKLIRTDRLAQVTGEEANTLLQRFDLEAQVTASLTSPHTVALYDFGVTEDGTFYYVMELLHGLDVERLVERFGPMPAERCVALLAQACDSLEEAHARGVIHRDIKPANLHVGRMGTRWDMVKVLDFGLVLRDSAPGRAEPRLTAPDQVGGTPAFMAPEMVLGREVDGRADLYALGCVAYWLLTGSMVFEGKTSLEVIMRHVDTQPVPPSQRAPLAVPRELEALVLSCLAKDPAARPADAAALRRGLRAVPLAEPWTDDDAARWWRMHLPELATEASPATAR
jgi:serine/threonine-protein kinase